MVATTMRLSLHDPGMTPIHRAGLGGLAASLRWIELHVPRKDHPPGQWSVEPHTVTLAWDKPEGAGPFLKALFALSFQLRNGLIFLPGQHLDKDPAPALLAELQSAMLLTFLQHCQTWKKSGEAVVQYQIDNTPMSVSHLVLTWYKHQPTWQKHKGVVDSLLTGKQLTDSDCKVSGPLMPGAAVRHDLFDSATTIRESPPRLLALAFAAVGCVTLRIVRRIGRRIERRIGVLVVPRFDDLCDFAEIRPFLTPRTPRECMVASPGDAAMQAALRLRVGRIEKLGGLRGCECVTLKALPWSPQQKSRSGILRTHAALEMPLDDFQTAIDCLPDRVVPGGQGRQDAPSEASTPANAKPRTKKTTGSKPPAQPFLDPSIIRPLIADNLATGRPWFAGFLGLCIGKDQFARLGYEQKGLHEMTQKIAWGEDSQATLVRAVHEAMRRRYGAVTSDSPSEQAKRNRMGNERERLRLAFAGAKTHEAFRFALTDLFSRAGVLSELQAGWQVILPLLGEERWKECRDLALLALASYRGSGPGEQDPETPVNAASESDCN